MEFGVRAAHYLARAQEQMRSRNPKALFYAALELRGGVEARLHEYRDSIRGTQRDNTWQVRILKREIEAIVQKFEKPVTFMFTSPVTGEKHPIRYVPVSTELKSIAERLGDYLHCIDIAKVQHSRFWPEFRDLVERGITLLSNAVSGELLAPLMWKAKTKTAVFKFDKDKMPPFFKQGASSKFEVKMVVVSKDEKGVRVRPAED